MRGIEGPRRDPESFPELLSVTEADPNNFSFLQFSVRGCRVGTAERRKKKERKKEQKKEAKKDEGKLFSKIVIFPQKQKKNQFFNEVECHFRR